MDKKQNLYELLDVPKEADAAQIKTAYKKLALVSSLGWLYIVVEMASGQEFWQRGEYRDVQKNIGGLFCAQQPH